MTEDNPTYAAKVTVTRRFTASAERVFDAWLDPATAGSWLFATAEGTVTRCDIDPRPGGTFTITDSREGEAVEHIGTYQEIDRPRRLVFSLSVPKYSSESARVIVEIAPSGDGCELTLTQEISPEIAEFLESAREGWTSILDSLANSLG